LKTFTTYHRHLRLLPTRRDRPRSRRTAEHRDELAPPHHSINSLSDATSSGSRFGGRSAIRHRLILPA
jgi:hypothetical protein